MDKINYIEEPYDEEITQNSQTNATITYDQIMSRLTRHLIRQEVSNTEQYLPQPVKQKPISTSDHITAKLNKRANSEKLPGYVQPYKGKQPIGELNTPVNKQKQANTNNNNTINEKIQSLIEQNTNGESENKLLLMRKIALHNNKIMSDKNRAIKTQMKFQ